MNDSFHRLGVYLVVSLSILAPVRAAPRFQITLPQGELIVTAEDVEAGRVRETLLWNERGRKSEILVETVTSAKGAQLGLSGGFATSKSIGVVLGDALGGTEYLCFDRKGEHWLNSKKAVLGIVPLDSRGIEMTSPTTFKWIRDRKPPDLFEVTAHLRTPGSIYYHVKKNGEWYLPKGAHFAHELPFPRMEPPKSQEDIRSLNSKRSDKDVPASNKVPVEQQTTTAPTLINSLRPVMWGIVLMAVLGLLWLVRNMRK